MIKIKEAILVEGRYDINTLKQLVDTVILETGGFRIFKDRERLEMIRKIAARRGILVLTDSDGAGCTIRGFLRGTLPKEQVKHAYVPEIMGKEARKRHPSKEGKLGVEGMPQDILLRALERAGATFLRNDESVGDVEADRPLVKADLYALGLSVLPQMNTPSVMPSAARLSRLRTVGAKCRPAIWPTSLRFISSGKGEYLSKVRRPAST